MARGRGGGRRGGRQQSGDRKREAPALGASAYAVLFAAYLGAALLVYGAALEGPFVSDDIHYVAANPFVHELSAENVWTILQPNGAATVAVVNYAPVQLLLHGVIWQIAGQETLIHHVVNVVLHVLVSLLLIPLLLRSGLPPVAALLGSAIFLLHPANVEAVAWISQLKTTLAMLLMLLALLAHPARPGAAAALFGLSLLAKPTAAVALPVAFVSEWVRTGTVRSRWLAVWGGALAAFALVEFIAHQRAGAAPATLYETPLVLLRTVTGLFARYVVLGTTGHGASLFHEPEPALTWLDPWWLLSLPIMALIGWRTLAALRGRRPEAAWWIWLLVSFGPVSQIFPFLYPFADRYLYFMLPGLIGGALLAGGQLAQKLSLARRRPLARVAVVATAAICVGFGVAARERAALWRSPALLVADAARNYPDGVSASLLRAKSATQAGNPQGAITALRAAVDRGFNRFEQLLSDPVFEPLHSHPDFERLLREIAAGWIESGGDWDDPTQMDLRTIASAHVIRGERVQAVALLRQALDIGGPLDAVIRADLSALGARPAD